MGKFGAKQTNCDNLQRRQLFCTKLEYFIFKCPKSKQLYFHCRSSQTFFPSGNESESCRVKLESHASMDKVWASSQYESEKNTSSLTHVRIKMGEIKQYADILGEYFWHQ